MGKIYKHLIIITLFVLITTFFIWLPHLLATANFGGLSFNNGFNTIYRNFDGLEYIIIAKTFYSPSAIAQIPQSLPASYFASHFPGFPLAMTFIAPLLGYLKSMLFISILFTAFSSIAFYFLIRDFKLTSNPLILTLVFLILPARWLIVRSVGSAEPMFIFFITLSIYFFMKAMQQPLMIAKYIWFSALIGALAQLTRPPGILLAITYGIYILWQLFQKKSLTYIFSFYPLFLIPLTLLGVFTWFNITLNDFFAYFHSGDNIHLVFPPFSVFNINQSWVGSIWLEDIIYIFILGLLGGFWLYKKGLYPISFFVFTYLIASMFVAHRDISRYILPVAPFVLIAFEKVLISKEFRIVLVILALAIYLYAQNFLLQNVAPAPDLSIYN